MNLNWNNSSIFTIPIKYSAYIKIYKIILKNNLMKFKFSLGKFIFLIAIIFNGYMIIFDKSFKKDFG